MVKTLMLFIFLQSFTFFVFGDSWRDPFNLSSKDQEVDVKLHENIELVGVINVGSDFGAILRNSGLQEVVFLNDQIWGHKVKEITLNHVLLVQNDKKVKLQIG